jgi:hypothetical protein
VGRTVPPSAEIQANVDKLLASGLVDDPSRMLSELARLGARLIIQRAVEEEFDSWLGRARYERRPAQQRGLRDYDSGLRNGFRPRRVQTAEGELRIEIPQVREAAEPFVSKLFRKGYTKRLLRTDPLRAMVVGAFVRGLSMRDVESLREEAGLGKTSKSTVAGICAELRERFEAFCRRDSTSSSWWRCSSTRSTCRCAPAAPRRASCAPGDSPKTATERWFPSPGGARGQGRLARARPRPDHPRARRTQADRGRRRARADLGDRAAVAARRPPAPRRSPPAQPPGQAAQVRTRPRPRRLLEGAETRPPASRTASSASRS